ncbi:isocitrate dehydrogenase [Streptomyces sp. 3MP-14]|uniref:Isocitrate dehydrogenase n=1 Tax=Streptomyces mimosae TaxID=2586635 RepID=A0A5N6AAF5_9ACTN|nr:MULTISPECIES: isocitrate/isopropylmalate family dehydrogenase [Streptomyces]KAB8165807.1 isocitrate dehydrogenase [Streptomyces mimosae]KAB8176196.1 isocitrate dehydrogenase [Streptomyces sp. 3MP-14]
MTHTAVVGLAVGRGTGEEVAAVFRRVLDRLAQLHGRRVRIERSPRTYHSYVSLRREGGGVERMRELTRRDAAHYEDFCRRLAAAGTRAVFRTAINAQSLYLVRQRLSAVKVDMLRAGDATLLLVRDEAQGFYTGENEHGPGVLHRTTTFSRDTTDAIIAFALDRARALWPDGPVERITLAYKYHLLDGALEDWAAEASARHGVPVELFQPDTVNRNLIAHGLPARGVIVAGNEWADIMHVVLLDRFGAGRQENHFTENAHLHPDVAGLVEYQTVHGSADDIEGTGTVNPVATIRAAAAIAERHAGCAGAARAVEEALDLLAGRGVGTPDLGGRHSTTEMVDALLDALRPHPVPGPATPRDPAAPVPGR